MLDVGKPFNPEAKALASQLLAGALLEASLVKYRYFHIDISIRKSPRGGCSLLIAGSDQKERRRKRRREEREDEKRERKKKKEEEKKKRRKKKKRREERERERKNRI